MQHWRDYAQGYKARAGMQVAERFIAAVEEALLFIQANPYACASYFSGEGYTDLQHHHFRKWNVKSFPHLLLFRVLENDVFIEALYAHKLDIDVHLRTEME